MIVKDVNFIKSQYKILGSNNFNSKNTQSSQNTKNDEFIKSKKLLQLESISSKYEVTNMSEEELKKMSYELHESWLISSIEQAILSPNNSKGHLPDINLQDPNVKRNYIEVFKNRLELNRKHNLYHTAQNDEAYKKVISTLEMINSLSDLNN